MPYHQERLVWAMCLLICVIGVIYFWNQYDRVSTRADRLEEEREALQYEIEALRFEGQELLPETRFRPLSEYHWRQLVNRGLTEPVANLQEDLMERGHLIPFDGVLGGTPDFYNPESIHVLNHRWVLAEFEDGHVMGHMLLEYSVDARGEVEWEVLVSELE